MKRIGGLVVLLALLLLVGLGLLVRRSLHSIEQEQAMRHEIVASRVFDEIERELTALTEREETRSFLEYRTLYVPENQLPGGEARSLSPLHAGPEESFVLGYFQIDPQGDLSLPLTPSPAQELWLAQNEIELPASPSSETLHAELLRLTERLRVPPPPPESPSGGDDTEGRLAEALPQVEPLPERPGSLQGPVDADRSLAAAGESPASGRKDGLELPGLESPGLAVGEKKQDDKTGESVELALASAEDEAGAAESPKKKRRKKPKGGDAGSDDKSYLESLNKGGRRRSSRKVRSAPYGQDNVDVFTGEQELQAGEATAEARDDEAPAEDSSGASGYGTQAEVPFEPNSQLLAQLRSSGSETTEDLLTPVQQSASPTESSGAGAGAGAGVAAGLAGDEPIGRSPGSADSLPSTSTASLAEPGSERSPAGGARSRTRAVRSRPAAVPSGRGSGSLARPEPSAAVLDPPGPLASESGSEPSQAVEVTVAPLAGYRVGADALVLHRAVTSGEARYVQGLALALPDLAAHMREELLAGGELEPFLDLTWVSEDLAEPKASAPGYRFSHSFEEPFGELRASLTVAPLPEEGTSSRAWVLWLAALLALVASLGFGSLYRMVSVVVHFAERRNNFVAAVSHELKTPLTSIRMYGEILRDGMVSDPERTQEYYRTITAESERLSRLIDNVLELSRLEKGTRSVSLKLGSVEPVLEDAVRLLSSHAGECGFELVLEIEPDLPPVPFDRDALLQVLINLVDNALKFARASDPREVVLECRAQGAGLSLSVRDHGPGVPPAQLRRIFQPFFRGERELTRTTKGTGIGLTLVRGLVEQMDGQISARNHPSGGFELTVLLS